MIKKKIIIYHLSNNKGLQKTAWSHYNRALDAGPKCQFFVGRKENVA